MNPAIQKTLSLVFLIVIGILIKKKINSKEQMRGIKVLILSIALPATIFVALLKIEFSSSLFYLPIFALFINFLLYFVGKNTIHLFGFAKSSPEARTTALLFPSLAPGLSCFPFIIEYAEEGALAFAALADVGNKVFVLVILYIIAMQWHLKTQKTPQKSIGSRAKGLMISLLKEPVNLVIVAALGMLYFGWNFTSLPGFLQDPIQRMSLLMTPLVLIFIGMAVKFDWQQFKKIGKLLFFRAACAFLISGFILLILPSGISAGLLCVLVVFPQSAASFWPFAHISLINDSEQDKSNKTFDNDLALNFLALSLPFSTMIILSICVFPSFFINGSTLLMIGGIGIVLLLIPRLFQSNSWLEQGSLAPSQTSHPIRK